MRACLTDAKHQCTMQCNTQMRQGFGSVMGYLERMFQVTKTGHVDLRDLELQDMPSDLLGVLGTGGKGDLGQRPDSAKTKKPKKAAKGPAAITKLSLTGNKLEYLPAFVGELSSLRKLHMDPDLIEPPLHIRDEGIAMMQQYLRRIVTAKAQLNLDLRGMMLTQVNLHYYKLSSLTSCDLGFNSLEAVPDEVFKYTDLSWLDLRNNLLDHLPHELCALQGLRQLDARGNKIEHVPAEIFARSALLTLSLANNNISALGGEAPALVSVRRGLAVHKGTGSTMTVEYDDADDLKSKGCNGGDGQGYGGDGGGGGGGGGRAGGGGGGWGWGELDLGVLQNLMMPDNCLVSIPQLAGSVLTNLNLSRNMLTDGVIERLSKLKHLRLLKVAHNRLTVIPEHIDALRALVLFDCSHNDIETLPPDMQQLTALCTLIISNNRIQTLPNQMFELTRLQQLRFSNNLLQFIPTLIGQLKDLRELLVDGNQIRSLPLELGNLLKIEKLDVDNNPGNLLPPGFAEKGLDAVMEFFAWNCRYAD